VDFLTGPFLLSKLFFLFLVLFVTSSDFFLVPHGRLSWIPVSFLVHKNIVSHIVNVLLLMLRHCRPICLYGCGFVV